VAVSCLSLQVPTSTLYLWGLAGLCNNVDLNLPLNERELANDIITDSRDCLHINVVHARRQGDVELKNGAMPLNFLVPISLTERHP
jgi:hypothetical protein